MNKLYFKSSNKDNYINCFMKMGILTGATQTCKCLKSCVKELEKTDVHLEDNFSSPPPNFIWKYSFASPCRCDVAVLTKLLVIIWVTGFYFHQKTSSHQTYSKVLVERWWWRVTMTLTDLSIFSSPKQPTLEYRRLHQVWFYRDQQQGEMNHLPDVSW